MPLSGGGERSGTNGRTERILTERKVGLQSEWVLMRKARYARVVVEAGRAWEEKGYAGPTGCGCAGPGTTRGGEVRMQSPGVWRLVGEWYAAGFGRRWRKRRRDLAES